MRESLLKRQKPTRCASCPVRERALFQPIPDEGIDDAQSRRFAQYQLPARHHLYHEGKPGEVAYTVYEGWMLLYRSHSDGSRQGLRIALPGDFIGFLPEGEKVLHHSAVAVTPTVLCAFRQEDLHALLDRRPQLAMHLARLYTRYMASCQAHMLGLGRKSAVQRIAYLIADLYHRLKIRGLVTPKGDQMPFPLTQEALGDLTGLTPVHTNRVMRRLREERVVLVESQQLSILDLPRLMEIGEFMQTDDLH